MKSTDIQQLIDLGFEKRKRSSFYYFNDIQAYIYEDYIFFKYNGKDLPLMENIDAVKKLISGIYSTAK